MRDFQKNLPGIKVHNHSKLGDEFEKDLDATHAQYEFRKIAKIDHHPSEWVYIGFDEYNRYLANPKTAPLVAITGNNRPMKRKATNVDFSGVCKTKIGIGFSIKFDAKMCGEKRISLDNFTRHQVENLVLSAKCGAIAGFMVNLYMLGKVFFISAEFVQKKQDKNIGKLRAAPGDGSISLEELEQFAVSIPYSKRFVDWYSVLVN